MNPYFNQFDIDELFNRNGAVKTLQTGKFLAKLAHVADMFFLGVALFAFATHKTTALRVLKACPNRIQCKRHPRINCILPDQQHLVIKICHMTSTAYDVPMKHTVLLLSEAGKKGARDGLRSFDTWNPRIPIKNTS